MGRHKQCSLGNIIQEEEFEEVEYKDINLTDLVHVNFKTRENSNFLKKGKIVILIKIRIFSRSRMTKRTFPFKSSREIELPCRISLDSEVVGISRFSRRGVSDDTWQGKEMSHGTSKE